MIKPFSLEMCFSFSFFFTPPRMKMDLVDFFYSAIEKKPLVMGTLTHSLIVYIIYTPYVYFRKLHSQKKKLPTFFPQLRQSTSVTTSGRTMQFQKFW